MKYKTTNELEHFDFAESYIAAVQKINSSMQLTLDNVTILPDNSCNRDVRSMRTNGLNLTIQNGRVEMLVEEGYKVYDADGKFIEQHEDKPAVPEQYNDWLKALADDESCIYSLQKLEDRYIFEIDGANERTYVLHISGTRDIEEWDRFLNKEQY